MASLFGVFEIYDSSIRKRLVDLSLCLAGQFTSLASLTFFRERTLLSRFQTFAGSFPLLVSMNRPRVLLIFIITTKLQLLSSNQGELYSFSVLGEYL